jgi:hypothetical protein
VPTRPRPSYRESSSEEEDEDDDEVDAGDDTYEDDDDDSIQSFSESEMGPRGGPFTDADLYVTAKYVAAFPAFDEASAKERWQPFGERVRFTLFPSSGSHTLHPVSSKICKILDRILSPI